MRYRHHLDSDLLKIQPQLLSIFIACIAIYWELKTVVSNMTRVQGLFNSDQARLQMRGYPVSVTMSCIENNSDMLREKACISNSFKYVFTLERVGYTGHKPPPLVKI